MPPPRPSHICIPSSLIPSTRPHSQYVHSLFIQYRQLSVSPSHQKRTMRTKRFTRQRRKMFSWLDGAGAILKHPRSDGIPNYLGALKNDGQQAQAAAFDTSKASKGQDGLQQPEVKRDENEEESDGSEKLLQVENFDPNEEERKEGLRRSDSSAKPAKRPPRLGKRELSPFPLNPHFMSQPVLSEEFRERIYLKVVEEKMTVRSVSAELGVSMERVGAVVRMKQMERDWLKQKKPLAAAYSRAVLSMLPKTEYQPNDKPRIDFKTGQPIKPVPHESINDLPVHPATTQQNFYPVAESRLFTRADAGRAFQPGLRSADERIPHPELIELEKFKAKGPTTPELQVFKDELNVRIKSKDDKALEKRWRKEANVHVYHGQKYDFRFKDVSVDDVGKDGRARSGVGWRYGTPHEDRKPGQVKIPTRVS